MINRIEIPLNRDYSDFPIVLGKATRLWIEQCDSSNAYIKFDDETTPTIKIKEDMQFEFEIPVQRIYLSVKSNPGNAKIVFIVFSNFKIVV